MRTILALLSLGACSSVGMELTYSDPPVELRAEGVRFAADLSYADQGRNDFDLAHFPDADEPTPLVIYIHGGGFQGGERTELYDDYPELIQDLTAEGVAVATIEYRLLDPDIDTEGVIKCLSDSQRALQYLRHHADDFHINPNRVALAGTSAGAGTSLWLGTREDLADPGSDDLIAQQSTRVSAVALWETQATYDLPRWTDEIFEPFDLDLFQTAEGFGLSQRLLNFYGITDADDLFSAEIEAYRLEVDMLEWMSSDDPPVWIHQEWDNATFPVSAGALFHHPFHARTVMEYAVEADLEVHAYIPKVDIEPDDEESAAAFLLRHL
ncbi:MAG: alpha/beta hydrolase [Deltaproteobacteria bacterium]|nr:MAG: alpha/beta hydrolase [Deltaproteobacteria bacterium]